MSINHEMEIKLKEGDEEGDSIKTGFIKFEPLIQPGLSVTQGQLDLQTVNQSCIRGCFSLMNRVMHRGGGGVLQK